MKKNLCWVLTGPTASGKTALSIKLAKAHDCEIVCMDSMQIYRHMNIGTAKPTVEEMAGIPHHMIDVAAPDESFSVARYQEMAEDCIGKYNLVGTVLCLLVVRAYTCERFDSRWPWEMCPEMRKSEQNWKTLQHNRTASSVFMIS